MEFWGVEVKAGEPLTVTPEEGQIVHISQAALGEVKDKKGASSVLIRMKVNGQKLIIGTLSATQSISQITYDLVLEKEFELSHDWKDGSIYFCGYTADNPADEDQYGSGSEESSDEEMDEEQVAHMLENGKIEPDVKVADPTKSKAASVKLESSTKPKVTAVEPKKEVSDEEDSSDGSDEEIDDESSSSDLSGDSSDDMDEDDESDDEETPKKPEPPSKKRPSESATKTPVPAKKSKTDTPRKTDGKKGSAHTATPHPSKKDGKKAAETPKSSGQVSCKSCSKICNSEKGLESHTKAKHGGK